MDNNITELVALALEMTSDIPGGVLNKGARATPFTSGGSSRYFMRLSDGERSVVALIETSGSEGLDRYYAIGSFLRENGIAVPEIYSFDRSSGIILMEDLGDCTLETIRLRGNGVLNIYRSCLDLLCMLQSEVTAKIAAEGAPGMERFGKEELLGETEYFENEFMERFEPDISPAEWSSERKKLAAVLAEAPAVFMHRDFQSRNIIINSNRPRLIDFQASYIGPCFYDAASLLKDPYASLPKDAERELLEYYYRRISSEEAISRYSFDEFSQLYRAAGIQRNLQALAAFAKLGFGDGKRHFLSSIPSALAILHRTAEENGSFPGIARMAASFLDEISKNGPAGIS